MQNFEFSVLRGKTDENVFSDMMKEPFGDDKEYMTALFSIGYIDKRNIVGLYNEKNILVSVFCLFDTFSYDIDGNLIPAFVMSYVVTPKAYRNLGYSSFLISSFLKNTDRSVFVFPSDKSLFSYYSKFGFIPCAFSRSFIFEKTDGVKKPEKVLVSDNNADEIYDIYLASKSEYEFFKSKEMFISAVKEAEISGGGLFFAEESYAFSCEEKGRIIVAEPFGKDFFAVAKALSYCGKVYLTLPSDNINNSEPLAMVYAPEKFSKKKIDYFYIDNFLNFNQYI